MDPETAIWIIVDIALAGIVVYTLFRYIRLKRRVIEAKSITNTELRDFTEKFKEYISNHGGRWAVIMIFNELIDSLVTLKHLELQKNLTTREILATLDNSLSRNIEVLLHEMYSLYEAARFGNYEPSLVEINQFNKKLELFNKINIYEIYGDG